MRGACCACAFSATGSESNRANPTIIDFIEDATPFHMLFAAANAEWTSRDHHSEPSELSLPVGGLLWAELRIKKLARSSSCAELSFFP